MRADRVADEVVQGGLTTPRTRADNRRLAMTGAADEAPSAADPLVGAVFGDRYRIEARLGGGGMGAVYRARHLALHRDVAVKLLHVHLTEDPEVSRRFDREALASSKLDHRNCVQILDAGTAEGGRKYLVMQLLEGCELRHAMKGPMPPSRVVEIARQILLGLEHAHRRGLVHRDLKPENVFIVNDDAGADVVKLVDFGIVKLISGEGSDERLTRAGMVFGTPWYMSPEQAAGGKVDERTDLYAVGVLMHEMLAGAPPFQGDDVGMVLRMQLIADAPPLPDSVPAPLRAIVTRLLEKDPKDRFASARATLDAIEAAAKLATEPATPGATPIVVAPAAPPPPVAVAPPPPVAAAPPPPAPQSGGTQRASSSRVVFMRAESLANPERSGDRGRLVLLAAVAIGFLTVLGTIALAVRGCGSSRTAAVDPPSAPSSSQPVVAAPLEGAPAAATEIPTPDASSVPVTNAPPASLDREASDAHERDREAHKRREKEERDARKRREKAEHEAHKHHKKAAKGHGKRGRH